MLDGLLHRLKALDVEITENYPLSRISAVRIGGNARLLLRPRSISSLAEVVQMLCDGGLKYKIVGRMTNILPPDAEYDGVVISTSALTGYSIVGTTLLAECGLCLGTVIDKLVRVGLGGFEELSGIPGSIGGMITMNAGAFGKEMADIILSVDVYSPADKRRYSLSASDLGMAYRSSTVCKKGLAVLSATLMLTAKDSNEISECIGRFREERLRAQPCTLPSLGSTFKRPSIGYASKMIDECGLRGFRLGGAEVSEKHAGFIVNRGGATAEQFKALITLCRESVAEKFGVVLEPEIEILD